MCFEFLHGLADKIYYYPPTHVKTQITLILASMIYFHSDISDSTNTVVHLYFDWKTVIYIYVCGKCRTQYMLPMEKSVTFTGACANEIIPSINRSFVYKAKEGRHVRIRLNNNKTNITVTA